MLQDVTLFIWQHEPRKQKHGIINIPDPGWSKCYSDHEDGQFPVDRNYLRLLGNEIHFEHLSDDKTR